jgi:4-hydroxy-2-oxoheptanedioate aldolase
MRRSRVLEKLRSGSAVSCIKLNLDNARVAELAAMSGADCLWLDLEHVACDWAVLEAQIYAAKAYDVDVMVRVARGSYSDYIRPLELDAAGIMVPHIMSLADAQSVIRMTRFHPVGRRPIDGGNADGAYAQLGLKDYIRQTNEDRFIVFQIEDPEPMAELDAIASLPGLDMLFFGPGDFSHGLGVPGDTHHPKLVEARKRIAAAALAHEKFAGTTGPVTSVPEFLGLGYRFLGIGADVLGLGDYFSRVVAEFAKLTSRTGGGR